MNDKKSTAALANKQVGGLHNARRGNKSLKQQDIAVGIVQKKPGLTATQVSWLAAGYQLDDKGNCIPADEFKRVNEFFNYKRRICEMSFKSEFVSDHPRARLVYGKALSNPNTESGGHGLYAIKGQVSPASMVEAKPPTPVQPVSQPEPKEAPAPPAPPPTAAKSAKKHIGNMMDLLND